MPLNSYCVYTCTGTLFRRSEEQTYLHADCGYHTCMIHYGSQKRLFLANIQHTAYYSILAAMQRNGTNSHTQFLGDK